MTRFAELLARLKTRTDRSYAALARRLDMNASTLHRYCAGEAVPLDFAVVERFAALCAASRQERVELHRLWILAVAERRRSRPSGSGARRTPPADGPAGRTGGNAGPAGGPVGPTGGSAGPAGGPAGPTGGTAGSGGTPEPGRTPGPGTTPASSASPTPLTAALAPATTSAGDTTTAPSRPAAPSEPSPQSARFMTSPPEAPASSSATAHPAPDPNSPSGPSSTPPGGTGEPGARSRAWYRRRPAVVSGVLATVLLLTAAGLSAFSGFPGLPGLGTSGTPGGGTSAQDGPPASPATASAPPSSPAAPFTWTVNSHMWTDDCGHDYVIDKPPRQVPPPPTAEDAEVWANAQDAVHGGQTIVRVAVQGRTSAAVVLEDLHVRVVRRSEAPSGGAYVYDTSAGCGGGLTPRSFDVHLDKRVPIARAVPGSRGDTILPARRLPYRVSVDDPEVLMVTAETEHCACDWYLDLDWSSQGRTGTIRIDDHGRPFRTAATAALPRYIYNGTDRRWVREDPRP
ncbi:transcriptional regulator [Streptomyces aureus]|uniref:transcriptional regulator n=1 Tax=Streptomyces aureus TaxID=193461 RepID=UPI0033E30182